MTLFTYSLQGAEVLGKLFGLGSGFALMLAAATWLRFDQFPWEML